MNRAMIRRARRRYLTMADAPLVADLAADLVARRFAEAIKSSFEFGHRGAERHGPRGPESPDGTTVEDLQRRGDDSRPDADEVA